MSWLEKRREQLDIAAEQGYKDAHNRMRGSSTAIVLSIIAKAINHPDKTYKMYDHIPSDSGIKNNMRMAARLVNEMNLEGFLFDNNRGLIRFTLNPHNKYINIHTILDPREKDIEVSLSFFLTLKEKFKILFSRRFFVEGSVGSSFRANKVQIKF